MAVPEVIKIQEKLSLFHDHWNPRIVAELNGQHVKLAKLIGEFVWHRHDNEDELFYVLEGVLKIEFRNRTVELNPGEMLVIPAGAEHRPVAEGEVSVLLFEPAGTVNTGNVQSTLTRDNLERL